MWDLILNPFITILLLLYQFLGQNVVLAIVVFTVLVRLVTYPLSLQQQRSAKAMSELQPELERLKKKYGNDREKLAQAQMELYREKGINPMGGCLPLLIQLPIMIALYQAIIQSLAANPLQLLDLHGRVLIPGLVSLVPLQNHFLWLNLAQPDPYYVLPILVWLTSWIQQRMITPSTPSDAQNPAGQSMQMMTTFMPIMFFFFALTFASGLSIYFIVSNLISIAQYSLTGQGDLKKVLGGLVPVRLGREAKPKDE